MLKQPISDKLTQDGEGKMDEKIDEEKQEQKGRMPEYTSPLP